MTIYAPAKVNLRLKILNRRPDGYHNIETVFERIALSDKIVLRNLKNDKIKLFCNHPVVPLDKSSLIYRAIHLLKKR
ncbi:MAG: 4-(cytidine 5'-diphospho)-2-C-methyl-D-erythritol kinase, partial [Candidatus Omnitrophota bacterium]